MADFSMVSSILTSTLTFSAPLILAALGGLCSERSGVINIGLEGKMLGAACATGFVTQATGNAFLGMISGLVTAILLSFLHWMLTQTYRMDHIISGMGINLLAGGATALIAKTFSSLGSEKMNAFPVAAYWVMAWTAVFGVYWYLRFSRGGLRLNAVGQDPDKSRQMGLKPVKVRFMALLWTGIFTGIAGALVVSNAGSFTDNMTAGRGFIALAALILGGWRPIPALFACLFFGFLDGLQLQLQGEPLFGQTIPVEFWQGLPYLVTILALAGLLGKGKRAPSGLGRA